MFTFLIFGLIIQLYCLGAGARPAALAAADGPQPAGAHPAPARRRRGDSRPSPAAPGRQYGAGGQGGPIFIF